VGTNFLVTSDDVYAVARAVGREPCVQEPERLEQCRRRLSEICVAYVNDRSLSDVSLTSLADKLAALEQKARGIVATVSYGPRQTTQELRRALSRAAAEDGSSAHAVNKILLDAERLSRWAARAHRQVRDKQKAVERPGKRVQTRHGALDRLIGDLLGVWLQFFDRDFEVSHDSDYVRYVRTCISILRARTNDTELAKLTGDTIFRRIQEATPPHENIVSLSKTKP